MEIYKSTIRLERETYLELKRISQSENESLAETIRKVIQLGLSREWVGENKDVIASIVREQMQVVIKPHIERLAKLTSKSGHMSATAAFLNIQSLQDLSPVERRKDPKEMYYKARKMAADYMKTPAVEWEGVVAEENKKGDE